MFAGEQFESEQSDGGEIMKCERTVCHEMKILNNMIKRYADAMIAAHFEQGITDVQGRVIGFLYHNMDRPIYQKDVEAEFSITRATTSKMLTLMEKNGLITRSSVVSDARLKRLQLTQSAQDFAARVQQGLDEFEQTVTRGLTAEEQRALLHTLRKMQANISAAAAEERSN